MKPILRSSLQDLHDYVPGKSIDEIRQKYGLDSIIKLASNENPLGPSPKAREVVRQQASQVALYPRGHAPELVQALGDFLHVSSEHIIPGNGSDEILNLVAQAFLEPGLNAVSAQETFSVYESVTRLMGAEFRACPLQNYRFDAQAILNAIDAQTRVVFICNPNNPTGTYWNDAELTDFMAKVPSHVLVLVDQAYCEYATAQDYPAWMGKWSQYPNLLLMRTFSKIWGLAGLRIGYALGSVEMIQALWKVKPPFNVNLLGQRAATAALSDQEHYQRSLELNASGMNQLQQGLDLLTLKWLPSQANFIAVETGEQTLPLITWLESQGIIVRGLKSFGLPAWIRITVGTQEQNAVLLKALQQWTETSYV